MRPPLVLLATTMLLLACGAPPAPPAAPILPPPAPLPPLPGADGTDPPPAPLGTAPPMPPPTGDREHDALRMGFWGCRVMGLRIMPTMDGTAVLDARLGAGGEVLEVTPIVVVGIPHTVVGCLVDRVRHVRFDPRGGEGSTLVIPVDFRRDTRDVAPASMRPLPTNSI